MSDFYSAYNELGALARQHCVSHLLNEIKKIHEKNKFGLETNEGIFCQRLKDRHALSEMIGSYRLTKGYFVSD